MSAKFGRKINFLTSITLSIAAMAASTLGLQKHNLPRSSWNGYRYGYRYGVRARPSHSRLIDRVFLYEYASFLYSWSSQSSSARLKITQAIRPSLVTPTIGGSGVEQYGVPSLSLGILCVFLSNIELKYKLYLCKIRGRCDVLSRVLTTTQIVLFADCFDDSLIVGEHTEP